MLPLLIIKVGYWDRAGNLRSKILENKLKTRIVGTLISQRCLDNNIGLVTKDENCKNCPICKI